MTASVDLTPSALHVVVPRRRRPVLVARPNVRQYGHLGLEIFMAIAEARRIAADVCLLRPRRVVGEALFALEPHDVRILRPGRIGAAPFQLRWFLAHAGPEAARIRNEALGAVKREARRELRPYVVDEELPEAFRVQLRLLNKHWFDLPRQVVREGPEPRYFSRRLFRERVEVALPPALAARAQRQAAEHGIPPGARIVALHVREAGYKRGQEMEDVKPGVREDSVRNAHVENYYATIEHLVARGYTVVRLGDPSMVPMTCRGVVDLALSPMRTNLLEVYCLLNSAFMIGCESGPSSLTYLTNTPCLWVNCTDTVTSYPIRPHSMYLLKRVRRRRAGRFLTLDEMLEQEYMEHFRHTQRHEYFDNTPEEILAATKEMIQVVEGTAPETPEQTAFRERATAAGVRLADELAYIRKWGPDDGFLGDGRIAQVALDDRRAGL